MIEGNMTDAERRAWNAALEEARKVADDERGAREAFSAESVEGWDAACEWIAKRIKALQREG